MPRVRTIRPEFFTAEDIVALSASARLLYIALWCEADREGRMAWTPATFRLRYFPADQIDIDKLAGELIERELVVPYGDGLAYLPNFTTWQCLNARESASKLPAPDASARVKQASGRDSDASMEKREDASGTRTGRETREQQFVTFLRSWPTTLSGDRRLEAARAWRRMVNGDAETVMAALEAEKQSEDWQAGAVPEPSVWLAARPWARS